MRCAELRQAAAFLRWLTRLLLGSLYPGAAFERKFLAMLLLNALVQAWSAPDKALRGSRWVFICVYLVFIFSIDKDSPASSATGYKGSHASCQRKHQLMQCKACCCNACCAVMSPAWHEHPLLGEKDSEECVLEQGLCRGHGGAAGSCAGGGHRAALPRLPGAQDGAGKHCWSFDASWVPLCPDVLPSLRAARALDRAGAGFARAAVLDTCAEVAEAALLGTCAGIA